MKNHELFNFMMNGSKTEVRQYLLQYGVDISRSEIKKLRTVFADASPLWLITGIPEDVVNNAIKVIGTDKYESLMKRLQSVDGGKKYEKLIKRNK